LALPPLSTMSTILKLRSRLSFRILARSSPLLKVRLNWLVSSSVVAILRWILALPALTIPSGRYIR
jgi:hypothetical protein